MTALDKNLGWMLFFCVVCMTAATVQSYREPEPTIHGQRLVTQHKAGTMPVALWKSDDWLDIPGQALKAGYHVNKAGQFVLAERKK